MISNSCHARCEADHRCYRTPCFEAQLKAQVGLLPVHRNVELCADHLGAMVQSLTAWARREGLTRGQVTVLAIDPDYSLRAADQAFPRTLSRAFEFGAIPLG